MQKERSRKEASFCIQPDSTFYMLIGGQQC